MSNQKGYKFRIYVDRPSMLVSKETKKRKRPNETFSPIGHVFFSLIDNKGIEKVNGLYANSFAFGKENVPEEDIIRIPLDLFKKVNSSVLDDTHRRYDDYKEYDITKEQFEVATKYVEEAKKNPPKFCVVTNNCTTFACKLAKKIGEKPPHSIIGIPIPHTYSVSIRAEKRLKQMQDKFAKTKQKISSFFNAEGKVEDVTTAKQEKKELSPSLVSKKLSTMQR